MTHTHTEEELRRADDAKAKAKDILKVLFPGAEPGMTTETTAADISVNLASLVLTASSVVCSLTKNPDKRREGAKLVGSQIIDTVEDTIIKEAMSIK